jgi:hypothetical protein
MVSAINRPHAYATPVGPSRWRSRARHSRQAASSATPGRRDPVEPRPSAGDRRVIRRLDLGDQFHVGEAAERAIEHPRPQTHAAAGALEHVVHDRQAVQVAIGKREKDLEPVRLQGERATRASWGGAPIYTYRYRHAPWMRRAPEGLNLRGQ